MDQASVFVSDAESRYRATKAELDNTKKELGKLGEELKKVQANLQAGQALIIKLRLKAATFSRVREELEEQVPVRRVQLDGVETGCVSPDRGRCER